MLLCTQKNGSINKILCLCIWEFWQNVLVNCCLQIVESLISSIMNKMEMLVLFVCLLFSIQASCCLSWVFHGWERVTCRWIVTVCSCYPQTPVLHASSRFSWAFLLCMHHLIAFFKEKRHTHPISVGICTEGSNCLIITVSLLKGSQMHAYFFAWLATKNGVSSSR